MGRHAAVRVTVGFLATVVLIASWWVVVVRQSRLMALVDTVNSNVVANRDILQARIAYADSVYDHELRYLRKHDEQTR